MTPTQFGPSVIRTLVPIIVAQLSAFLLGKGIDAGAYQELITQVVGGLIAAAYYTIARVLETRFSKVWGWLLGLPKQPTYEAPAAPSPVSPTGAVATEDTPGVPEGEPVAVVPADGADETYPPIPDIAEGIEETEGVAPEAGTAPQQ
jgi:hypothetical protein